MNHHDKRLVTILRLAPVCIDTIMSELLIHSVLELIQSVERIPNTRHLIVVGSVVFTYPISFSIEHLLGKDLHNSITLGVRETSLIEDARYLIFKMNFKLKKALVGRKFYNRPSFNCIANIANRGEMVGLNLFLNIGHDVMDITHCVSIGVRIPIIFRFQQSGIRL